MNETYIIANRTDVGRAREHNEDSMVTFDSPNGRVIAVCDGMGGQAAGDVASRLACDIITDILTNNTFSTPNEAITRAIMAANQGILHKAATNPGLEGMGATCVMVIIKDGQAWYGWVGDSRIYYISNGIITQISRDQSYVQQLVDAGKISMAEAESHPQKNEITNALGVPDMTPPELCATPLSPVIGSIIMLCSDGLSGMVDNNKILSILSEPNLTLQHKADKLVDQANANGGTDNITVQLIQIGNNRPSSFSTKKEGNSKILLYISIALAIIVLIGILFFTFSNKEEKIKEPAQIEDNRTPAVTQKATQKAKPAVHKTTPSESKKVSEPKTGQKAKPENNKKGATDKIKKTDNKVRKTFGETGQKGDNTAVEKVTNTNEPGKESVDLGQR